MTQIDRLLQASKRVNKTLPHLVERFMSTQSLNLLDGDLQTALRDISASAEALRKDLDTIRLVTDLLEQGSTAATVGEFPECVAVGNADQGYFASGVLLDPKWLLTSSHCRDATKMYVGIDVNLQRLADEYPLSLAAEDDLLVLFEVSDFQGPIDAPTLPPNGCDLEEGTRLRVVAFGETDPMIGMYGTERHAQFLVEEALDETIRASSVSAICPGDSGGPAFYDDGSKPRLLLGICDSVIGDDCRSGGIFATLVGRKKWIEDNTGMTFDKRCP